MRIEPRAPGLFTLLGAFLGGVWAGMMIELRLYPFGRHHLRLFRYLLFGLAMLVFLMLWRG